MYTECFSVVIRNNPMASKSGLTRGILGSHNGIVRNSELSANNINVHVTSASNVRFVGIQQRLRCATPTASPPYRPSCPNDEILPIGLLTRLDYITTYEY